MRKGLLLVCFTMVLMLVLFGAAYADPTGQLPAPQVIHNLTEDGEGGYSIEIATPLQGTLGNLADYADKDVSGFGAWTYRVDGEERELVEGMYIPLENNDSFSVDTSRLEANGSYVLLIWINSNSQSWAGTEIEIPFTVTCSVPEGEVRLTASTEETLTDSTFFLRAVAPGAEYLQIMSVQSPTYAYSVASGDRIAISSELPTSSSPGQHEYYAIATYANGETRESDHVTISYTTPYGRLEDALTVNAPTYVTAGEAFDIRLEDKDPETDTVPDFGYVYLYEQQWGSVYSAYIRKGEAITIPAENDDGETILQDGVCYTLDVQIHKAGWEYMQKQSLLVAGQPSATCTLAINGSTEAQEIAYGDTYTVTFSGLPGNVTAVSFTDPDRMYWENNRIINSSTTYTETLTANSLASNAAIWGRYTTDPIADPEATDWTDQVSWTYINPARITVTCDHSITNTAIEWIGSSSYTVSEEDPVHKHIRSGTAREIVQCRKCFTILEELWRGPYSEEDQHFFVNGSCFGCGYECQHEALHQVRYDRIEGNKTQHMVTYPDSNYCQKCHIYVSGITTGTVYEDHVDADGNGVCDICGETPEGADWDWHLAEMDYKTKLLVIEGSGAIPDFGSAEQTPWYRDREQIKGIILGEDITRIGANAFAGLTGTTRVDFNQATTPEIDENAFAGSNIVCRYYTTEGTWPAATVTSGYGAASIKWVYMSLNTQTAKDGIVIFAPKGEGAGWYVWYMGDEYPVTREQAIENSYMSREVRLRAKPTEQADRDVYEADWDIIYYLDIDFPQSTTNETFSVAVPQEKQYLSMHIGAEGWTVNVTAGNNLGTISTYHGTINITAPSISTLQAEKDYYSQGAKQGNVTVNGDVQLLNYYSGESSQPYTGNLTVNGTVHSGYEYGKGRIIIPNVTEIEGEENAICRQFSEVNQAEPIVLNSELNVAGAEQYATYSAETCRLSYQVQKDSYSGYRWHLQMYPMQTNTDHLQFYDLQNMKEGGFTADDIYWGPNTGVILLGLQENDEIQFNGAADGTGLSSLNVYGGTATVNCQVSQIDVSGDSEKTSHVTLNAPVTQMYLYMSDGAEKRCTVTAGEGGSVKNGTLTRSMYENLYFENVAKSGPILGGGRLQVLNHKQGQRIATILPSDDKVTAAAADKLGEGEIAVISAEDAGTGLNSDEQEAFDDLPETAGGTIDAAVNVSVAAVDPDSGSTIREISELQNEVEVSVENVTGGEAFVVRLHEDENGDVTATTMTQPSAAKVFTFESDLFSRYLLVKTAPIDPDTLDKLVLPEDLTRIEDNAFENGAFQAVIIPDGCTSIGKDAFKNCRNLIYVSYPAGITGLEEAFTECNVRSWNER